MDGLVDEGVKNACGGCGAVPAELCNGVDDNCNGQVDEAFPSKGAACDGPDGDFCAEGQWVCNGVGLVCSDGTPTNSEACNGVDDNCNGQVDEGVKNACGSCGPLPAEACNGVDDNCNGVVDEGANCGCKWAQIGPTGHAYQFCGTQGEGGPGKMKWLHARNYCNARGYRLVSLTSASEHGNVALQAEAFKPNKNWWLGLSDKASEGNFTWETGEPYGSFTAWGGPNPNNDGNEDCAELKTKGVHRWNDTECGSKKRFICESF